MISLLANSLGSLRREYRRIRSSWHDWRRERRAYRSFDHSAFFERLWRSSDPQAVLECLKTHPRLDLVQNRPEIVGLGRRIAERSPRTIVEIGTARGGTTLFLKGCCPQATVITIDIARRNPIFFAKFGPAIGVHSIRGNSLHLPTMEQVARLLNGVPLDVLFIDGDHSYEGVAGDFAAYRSLVRDGVIAFHDIVPDHQARHGTPTSSWAGEVPRFWNEIKSGYPHEEWIEDPNQDGRGIGILFVGAGSPMGTER